MIAQAPEPIEPNPFEVGFTVVFLVLYASFFLLAFGGMALAIAALVSAARRPAEVFGPWWDNTKTAWLLGIAAGFLIPCASVVTGSYWFFVGRKSIGRTGVAARPFWVGPPKPPPPQYWPPAPPPTATP